jgi:hypothetical protein
LEAHAKKGRFTGKKIYYPVGFPQGGNFSPFLSIMTFAQTIRLKFAKLLMFADDGLFYGSKKFVKSQVEDFFMELGHLVAPAKSG